MRFKSWMTGAIALSSYAQPPAALIEQVRENSLNYVSQLPNFLCEEVVDRSYSRSGSATWTHIDTVKAQVTYFDGHEEYTQVRVNDKTVRDSRPGSIRGVMAEGEFGSLLQSLFEAQTQTHFEPDRRKKLRGREMSVFKYDVKLENSRYRMFDGPNQSKPAFGGEIYVDDDTKMVMRLVLTPYDLPGNFRIRSLTTSIDYQMTNVSGKPFHLPVRAEVITQQGNISTRNEEKFQSYRKFGTQTNLTFDWPDGPVH